MSEDSTAPQNDQPQDQVDRAQSEPTETSDETRARTFRWRSAKVLFTIVGAAVVWQLVYYFFLQHGPKADTLLFAQSVVLPVSMMALLCLVATRHQLRWSRPLQRLRLMLPLIRTGHAPIEELSSLEGAAEIGHLVPVLRELLQDLRRQRLELTELNEEIRQRIAQRTDALERKVGSLKHQATRDKLTGLGNRRMFDDALQKMFEKCREDKTDLCVLMIDVDNFKKLNDTLGHPSGDQLLRNIGQLIHSSVRYTDAAFRFGGDEFVVLMPDADERAARGLAHRLVTLMDLHAKTLAVDPKPRLSCGLAQLSALPDVTPEQLLHAADQNLYKVKGARKSAAAQDRNPPLSRSA